VHLWRHVVRGSTDCERVLSLNEPEMCATTVPPSACRGSCTRQSL
jgi:hypothetical protein